MVFSTDIKFILFGFFIVLLPCVFASSSYFTLIPNASNVPCTPNSQNCTASDTRCPAFGHFDSVTGFLECSMPSNVTDVNNFGRDFKANNNNWVATCNLDSDNDGKTNGDELGDPCCVWFNGTTPRFTAGISHPGDTGDITSRPSCQDAISNSPTAFKTLQVTGTSVTLDWFMSNADCFCGFQVQIVNKGAYNFSSPATTQVISDLSPETSYNAYVKAFNWQGYGVDSSVLQFTTLPATVADPPTNLTSKSGKSNINVTWIAPADDGDSPISGYEIEWDDLFTYTVNRTWYNFKDLQSDEDYRIRIRTVNGVGKSSWSAKYKFSTKASASTFGASLFVVLFALLLTL